MTVEKKPLTSRIYFHICSDFETYPDEVGTDWNEQTNEQIIEMAKQETRKFLKETRIDKLKNWKTVAVSVSKNICIVVPFKDAVET